MNRRLVQWGVIAAAILIVVLTNLPEDVTQPNPANPTADLPFDFYVLALSWSPAFCQTEAGQRSRSQCGGDADFGFITHGLWPQFEDGWPSFCQSDFGSSFPDREANRLFDVMPDRGLIEHQWDKHGTCSGLSPASYAGQILEASDIISVPAEFAQHSPSRLDAREIEDAFIASNSALSRDGIAVQCRNGRFTEVRICLSQELEPRTCRQVDGQGCQQSSLTIAPR